MVDARLTWRIGYCGPDEKRRMDNLKGRRPRIRGIQASAVALGCSRVHLQLCLAGVRKGSPALVRRYLMLRASMDEADRRAPSTTVPQNTEPITKIL